jgi:hypothetical protein
MVGAQAGLTNRQSALAACTSAIEIALVCEDASEVAKADGSLRVIGAQAGLTNR